MILILITSTHLISMILLIVSILIINNLLYQSLNLLIIVIGILGHRATPQIDVGQDSVDGIGGDITPVTPIVLAIATRLHDILTSLLQVVNTMLKNLSRSALRQSLHLCIILNRVCHIRHITESSNQIEIAQRTQGLHLGTNHLIVTLSELWVEFHHIGCMVQHDVTVVNHLIVALP